MQDGVVRELWRYPVKSMGGERIQATTIGELGIFGDRGWVVRDETTGRFGTAKRIPGLFMMSARYVWEPEGDESPAAEITLPDGWKVRSDNPKSAERVGEALGREVTLWPRHPAGDLDFYKTPKSTSTDPVGDARIILGLEGDEAFPKGLSTLPGEIRTYMAPPGTYVDAFPVMLVTSASLATLHAALGETSADIRRFRPNLVIDTPEGTSGFPEFAWAGKKIRVGGAVLEAVAPCVRCAMITHPQPGLDRDTPLMRYLARETEHNLGLYLRVVQAGPVSVGDTVEVV